MRVAPIAVPDPVVIALVALAAAGIIARIGWTIARPSADSTTGLEPDARPAS